MRYTVGKDFTGDCMGYNIKRNGKKIAEFWYRCDAVAFKDAMVAMQKINKRKERTLSKDTK